MDSLTLQIESVIINITDKIISFLPNDLFIRLILVMMTLVIVFGISRLLSKEDQEDTN